MIAECAPIAAALDELHAGPTGGAQYSEVLAAASTALREPDTLPSARVLAAMAKDYDNSFVRFARAQSEKARVILRSLPLAEAQHARFTELTRQSIAEQKQIEASDSMPFEVYRQQYVSASRLGIPGMPGISDEPDVAGRAALAI